MVFGIYEVGKYLWELQDAATQAAAAQEAHKGVLEGMSGLVGGATASIRDMVQAYNELDEGEKVYQRSKVDGLIEEQDAALKQGRRAIETAVPSFVDGDFVYLNGKVLNEKHDIAAGTLTATELSPVAHVAKLANDVQKMDNAADVGTAIAEVSAKIGEDKEAKKLLAELLKTIYGTGNYLEQLKQRDDLRARKEALNAPKEDPVALPVPLPKPGTVAEEALPVPSEKPAQGAALDAGGVASMIMQAAQSLTIEQRHTHKVEVTISAPPGVEASVKPVQSRTEPSARSGPSMMGAN